MCLVEVVGIGYRKMGDNDANDGCDPRQKDQQVQNIDNECQEPAPIVVDVLCESLLFHNDKLLVRSLYFNANQFIALLNCVPNVTLIAHAKAARVKGKTM